MRPRKLPTESFEYYLGLGVGRSYRAVAEHYNVSKVAVTNRGTKEGWQARIAELERQARARAEEKAVDELDAVRARHLKEARFLQARALQVLKDQPPEKGIRAANALAIAWKHELLLLGEPTERQASVDELIKTETRELLMVVDDEDDPGAKSASDGP